MPRNGEVHEVVSRAGDPDAEVVAALEHLDLDARRGPLPVSRSGPCCVLLHFGGRDDADDFAALHLPALDEFDPAIEVGKLTGDRRLGRLRGEAQRVAARGSGLPSAVTPRGIVTEPSAISPVGTGRRLRCAAERLPASRAPARIPTSHVCFIRVLLRKTVDRADYSRIGASRRADRGSATSSTSGRAREQLIDNCSSSKGVTILIELGPFGNWKLSAKETHTSNYFLVITTVPEKAADREDRAGVTEGAADRAVASAAAARDGLVGAPSAA